MTVPTTFANESYFQSDDVWHTTDDRDSLCGKARLRYNIDNVADAVPMGGVPCAGCAEARGIPVSLTANAVIATGRRRKPKK